MRKEDLSRECGKLSRPDIRLRSAVPLQEDARPHRVAILTDETQRNPQTVMPPFGRNRILTAQEINAIVDFLQDSGRAAADCDAPIPVGLHLERPYSRNRDDSLG
jgi:hypothetical protein